jgi:hypothetical protein
MAFSSIASNTGASSPGEELITCKTSAVAVCCSNASRVSVKSRAFSIAMTASEAKFSSSAICLSEKGLTSRRLADDYTEQLAILAQWHCQLRPDTVLNERAGNRIVRSLRRNFDHVMYVEKSLSTHQAAKPDFETI